MNRFKLIKRYLLIIVLSLSMIYPMSMNVNADLGIGLKIKVVNSITSKPVEGAVYEICENNLFNKTIYTITTNVSGEATQDNLSLGVWYLRQKSAPSGYIKYTEVIPVSIGAAIFSLNLKLTPFGSIEVNKVDNKEQPVQGAIFSLFKGTLAIGSPLYTDLTSDSLGKITVNDVVPGFYTLLETKVPIGYHLNAVPTVFEVLAGNKQIVKIVNQLIQRGTINLYKKDAVNQMQLAGAKFGVYSDITYTTLIKEVTSIIDAPAIVSNLLPGTYYIKELEAPNGYLLDALPQTILLLEGQTANVTFYNNRNYPTALNEGGLLILGLIMLSSSITLVILFHNKTKKCNKVEK